MLTSKSIIMRKLMKLDGWIAAFIGIAFVIVGIVIFFFKGDVCEMNWDDWFEASIPFILWAICMRVYAFTHEEKKQE